MVEQLIARVFCTRDNAHLSHWKTPSYAEHIALGDFYEDIIEKLDNFIECHQGNSDLIDKVQLSSKPCSDILKCLEEDCQWIEKNYKALSDGVTPLQNLLDELMGVYIKAIYKLKFLS